MLQSIVTIVFKLCCLYVVEIIVALIILIFWRSKLLLNFSRISLLNYSMRMCRLNLRLIF